MASARGLGLVIGLVVFVGCDGGAGRPDAGGVDAGASDGGWRDGGGRDAGGRDGGARDGGVMDGAMPDGGPRDGGATDGGALDGGAEMDAARDAAGPPPDGGPDGDHDGFDRDRELACGTDPANGADFPTPTALRGVGTPDDPYRLCFAEHLALYAALAGVTSAHARLGADLDATGVALGAPIGTPESPFVASFDGAGYTIANLTVGTRDAPRPGLFARVGASGAIHDLALVDAVTFAGSPLVDRHGGTIARVFVGATAVGGDHLGLVANVVLDTGVIEDAGSAGSVTGINSHIGGLVGENLGVVRRSWSTARASGQHRTGGLVGSSYGSIVESWASGAPTGTGRWIGGLLGTARPGSTVRDSYALGDVTAAMSTAGGLIGNAEGNASIARVYARSSVSAPVPRAVLGEDTNGLASLADCYFEDARGADARCTGVPAADMTRRERFSGFDFDVVWTLDVARRSSPILRWE
jgi:hypothetical protein